MLLNRDQIGPKPDSYARAFWWLFAYWMKLPSKTHIRSKKLEAELGVIIMPSDREREKMLSCFAHRLCLLVLDASWLLVLLPTCDHQDCFLMPGVHRARAERAVAAIRYFTSGRKTSKRCHRCFDIS